MSRHTRYIVFIVSLRFLTLGALALAVTAVACEGVIGADFDRNAKPDAGVTTAPTDPSGQPGGGAGAPGTPGSGGMPGVSSPDGGDLNVDVQTNPEHCGVRNHSCLGGDCVGGVCKAISVAVDRWLPSDLAFVGDYRYFVEQGTGLPDGRLTRVLRASCTQGKPCVMPETLVSDLRAPAGLALSNTEAFITRGTGASGQVLRYAFDASNAGGTRVFADMQTFPTRAVFLPTPGNERVVWLQSGTPGALRARALTGSDGAISLLAARSNPADITLRGERICWSESGDPNLDLDGRVYCADSTGQNAVTMAENQAAPRGLAIDGTHVYWVNRGDGTLHRRRLDQSTDAEELQAGLDNPSSIAVDGDRIVWLESGTEPDYSNGRIRASDKNGKNVRVLTDAETWPTRMVMDAQAVYFISRGTPGKKYKDAQIRRIAL